MLFVNGLQIMLNLPLQIHQQAFSILLISYWRLWGCAKSHTIKSIYMAITKLLMQKGGNPEKARIIVLATTGVAAVNISYATIHSGLGINFGSKMFHLND